MKKLILLLNSTLLTTSLNNNSNVVLKSLPLYQKPHKKLSYNKNKRELKLLPMHQTEIILNNIEELQDLLNAEQFETTDQEIEKNQKNLSKIKSNALLKKINERILTYAANKKIKTYTYDWNHWISNTPKSTATSSIKTNSNAVISNVAASRITKPYRHIYTLEEIRKLASKDQFNIAKNTWLQSDDSNVIFNSLYEKSTGSTNTFDNKLSAWQNKEENLPNIQSYLNHSNSFQPFITWLSAFKSNSTLQSHYISSDTYTENWKDYKIANSKSITSYIMDSESDQTYSNWINSIEGIDALTEIYKSSKPSITPNIQQDDNISEDDSNENQSPEEKPNNFEDKFINWVYGNDHDFITSLESKFLINNHPDSSINDWTEKRGVITKLAKIFKTDSANVNLSFENWMTQKNYNLSIENILDNSESYPEFNSFYSNWVNHKDSSVLLRNLYKTTNDFKTKKQSWINTQKQKDNQFTNFLIEEYDIKKLTADNIETNEINDLFEKWIIEPDNLSLITTEFKKDKVEYMKNFTNWRDDEYRNTTAYNNDFADWSRSAGRSATKERFNRELKFFDYGDKYEKYKFNKIAAWLDSRSTTSGDLNSWNLFYLPNNSSSEIRDEFPRVSASTMGTAWIGRINDDPMWNRPSKIRKLSDFMKHNKNKQNLVNQFLSNVVGVSDTDNPETFDTRPNVSWSRLVAWVQHYLIKNLDASSIAKENESVFGNSPSNLMFSLSNSASNWVEKRRKKRFDPFAKLTIYNKNSPTTFLEAILIYYPRIISENGTDKFIASTRGAQLPASVRHKDRNVSWPDRQYGFIWLKDLRARYDTSDIISSDAKKWLKDNKLKIIKNEDSETNESIKELSEQFYDSVKTSLNTEYNNWIEKKYINSKTFNTNKISWALQNQSNILSRLSDYNIQTQIISKLETCDFDPTNNEELNKWLTKKGISSTDFKYEGSNLNMSCSLNSIIKKYKETKLEEYYNTIDGTDTTFKKDVKTWVKKILKTPYNPEQPNQIYEDVMELFFLNEDNLNEFNKYLLLNEDVKTKYENTKFNNPDSSSEEKTINFAGEFIIDLIDWAKNKKTDPQIQSLFYDAISTLDSDSKKAYDLWKIPDESEYQASSLFTTHLIAWAKDTTRQKNPIYSFIIEQLNQKPSSNSNQITPQEQANLEFNEKFSKWQQSNKKTKDQYLIHPDFVTDKSIWLNENDDIVYQEIVKILNNEINSQKSNGNQALINSIKTLKTTNN